MSKSAQRFFFPAGIILWGILVFFIWSPRHYWPDADGYLLHVAEGRWVAHPPGYALFVMLGRCFHATGGSPYFSVQLASLSLTIAGLGVLYRLLREFVGPLASQAMTLAAAFSWIVLLNVQTGTSHASDLFTVSLLLFTAVRLPCSSANAWKPDLVFALALFLCAALRLTTFLMMGPLLLLIAWSNKRRLSFWSSCLIAAGALALWQGWVIAQSGGYAAYSAAAEAMSAGNRPSSVILSGFTPTTVLNMIRALLWTTLGILPFLMIMAARWRQPHPAAGRRALLYGLTALLFPLLAVSLYLCTHPGYVVCTLPGAALAAAGVATAGVRRLTWGLFGAAVLVPLAVFLFVSPFMPPASKWQAVANGILLQYSASCSRQAVFNTTARWLRLGGLSEEIPAHRALDLETEDKWREEFEKLNPSRAD